MITVYVFTHLKKKKINALTVLFGTVLMALSTKLMVIKEVSRYI